MLELRSAARPELAFPGKLWRKQCARPHCAGQFNDKAPSRALTNLKEAVAFKLAAAARVIGCVFHFTTLALIHLDGKRASRKRRHERCGLKRALLAPSKHTHAYVKLYDGAPLCRGNRISPIGCSSACSTFEIHPRARAAKIGTFAASQGRSLSKKTQFCCCATFAVCC